jgi:hypothetical protein
MMHLIHMYCRPTDLCVTHFKRISCRLGLSRLVIGNRTEVLHVQKRDANILNKQLCKPTAGGHSC